MFRQLITTSVGLRLFDSLVITCTVDQMHLFSSSAGSPIIEVFDLSHFGSLHLPLVTPHHRFCNAALGSKSYIKAHTAFNGISYQAIPLEFSITGGKASRCGFKLQTVGCYGVFSLAASCIKGYTSFTVYVRLHDQESH